MAPCPKPACSVTYPPRRWPEPTPASTDSLGTALPTLRPDRPIPYLDGIELRFALDSSSLVGAFESGDLDGISGLSPATSVDIAAATGSCCRTRSWD